MIETFQSYWSFCLFDSLRWSLAILSVSSPQCDMMAPALVVLVKVAMSNGQKKSRRMASKMAKVPKHQIKQTNKQTNTLDTIL